MNKFKRFFIEEDDDEKKKGEVVVKNTQNFSFERKNPDPKISGDTFASIANDIIPTTTQNVNNTSSINNEEYTKCVEHIKGVLENVNSNGPNLNMFISMMAQMGDIPEDAKYKAAFGGLKGLGLTKDVLLNSATILVSLIDNDKIEFSTFIKSKINENQVQIEGVRNTVNNNLSAIEKIKKETEEEIERVKALADAKIQKLESDNRISNGKVAPTENENVKLNNRLDIYDKASQEIKASISEYIRKINLYIN